MFRVAWRSLKTDARGWGKYILNKEEAKQYVKQLNELFPEITHWIEADLAPLKISGHRCSYGDMTFIPARSPVSLPSSPEAS